jgi:hypothetical protein
MRIFFLFSLFFLFFLSNNLAVALLPSPIDSLSPDIKIEELEMPDMTETEATALLLRGETQVRKARNAFIFSIITLGLFYILALFWLVAAFVSVTKARRYFRNFSDNNEKKAEANRIFQKLMSVMMAHVVAFLLLGLLVLGFSFTPIASLFTTLEGLSFFMLVLGGIGDYFFFHIFFDAQKEKNKKK